MLKFRRLEPETYKEKTKKKIIKFQNCTGCFARIDRLRIDITFFLEKLIQFWKKVWLDLKCSFFMSPIFCICVFWIGSDGGLKKTTFSSQLTLAEKKWTTSFTSFCLTMGLDHKKSMTVWKLCKKSRKCYVVGCCSFIHLEMAWDWRKKTLTKKNAHFNFFSIKKIYSLFLTITQLVTATWYPSAK